MDKRGGAAEYMHLKCGKRTRPVLTCNECGEPLRPEEVKPRLGPALHKLIAELLGEAGESADIPPLLRPFPCEPLSDRFIIPSKQGV